jgi:hypothetical protein
MRAAVPRPTAVTATRLSGRPRRQRCPLTSYNNDGSFRRSKIPLTRRMGTLRPRETPRHSSVDSWHDRLPGAKAAAAAAPTDAPLQPSAAEPETAPAAPSAAAHSAEVPQQPLVAPSPPPPPPPSPQSPPARPARGKVDLDELARPLAVPENIRGTQNFVQRAWRLALASPASMTPDDVRAYVNGLPRSLRLFEISPREVEELLVAGRLDMHVAAKCNMLHLNRAVLRIGEAGRLGRAKALVDLLVRLGKANQHTFAMFFQACAQRASVDAALRIYPQWADVRAAPPPPRRALR